MYVNIIKGSKFLKTKTWCKKYFMDTKEYTKEYNFIFFILFYMFEYSNPLQLFNF